METDIDTNLRKQGVVSNLDGAAVIKVPAARLPENCGFILCHPCATVAPTKLEDYKIHQDPPGISGSLVEGRICYDAFVLENKKMAIYYQELKAQDAKGAKAAPFLYMQRCNKKRCKRCDKMLTNTYISSSLDADIC